MKIEGIEPLSASAIVATISHPKLFKNGREVSAWLGLVPKQHSSGNTQRLSGISKRGHRYVRTLLIHGARSVVKRCERKADNRSLWIANKNARIIWAMLATGECYRQSVVM